MMGCTFAQEFMLLNRSYSAKKRHATKLGTTVHLPTAWRSTGESSPVQPRAGDVEITEAMEKLRSWWTTLTLPASRSETYVIVSS